MLLEMVRKRNECQWFIPIKIVPAHAKLQEKTTCLKNLGGAGMNLGGMDIEEVEDVYEVVKMCCVGY